MQCLTMWCSNSQLLKPSLLYFIKLDIARNESSCKSSEQLCALQCGWQGVHRCSFILNDIVLVPSVLGIGQSFMSKLIKMMQVMFGQPRIAGVNSLQDS